MYAKRLPWLALVASWVLCSAAAAQQKVMYILDDSGSMKEKIQGEPKIDIAKRVFNELIDDLPVSTDVGLVVFYDCGEIRIEHKLGADRDAIKQTVDALEPKNRTPIDKSLRVVGQHLRDSGLVGQSTIVLVL